MNYNRYHNLLSGDTWVNMRNRPVLSSSSKMSLEPRFSRWHLTFLCFQALTNSWMRQAASARFPSTVSRSCTRLFLTLSRMDWTLRMLLRIASFFACILASRSCFSARAFAPCGGAFGSTPFRSFRSWTFMTVATTAAMFYDAVTAPRPFNGLF